MQHKYQTVFEHDACIYESHFIDRTVYIQPIANKMYKANNSSKMHRLQMSLSVYRFLFFPTQWVMTEWNYVVAMSLCQSETVLYRTMTSWISMSRLMQRTLCGRLLETHSSIIVRSLFVHSEISFWICNYLKLAHQSHQSHQSHQDKEGIDGDTMVTKVHAEGVPSRNQRRCAEWSADAESSAILICSGRCVSVSRYFWLHSLLIVFSLFSHCFLIVFSLFSHCFLYILMFWCFPFFPENASAQSSGLSICAVRGGMGFCNADRWRVSSCCNRELRRLYAGNSDVKIGETKKAKKNTFYIIFISLYMNQSESWDRWRDQEDETRATFHFRHIAGALADLGEDLLTDLGRFRTMSVCDGWEIGNHFPSWYSTSPLACKKTRRRHSTRANLF